MIQGSLPEQKERTPTLCDTKFPKQKGKGVEHTFVDVNLRQRFAVKYSEVQGSSVANFVIHILKAPV